MLNVEKYKDEIKKFGIDKCAVDKKGNIFRCRDEKCHECLFDDTCACSYAFIDWLCEEYKGPILSNDERRYLLNVIEPFLNDVTYVEKIRSTYGDDYIRIKVKGFGLYCMIPIPKKDMFANMLSNEKYYLRELGIEMDEDA